MGRRSACSVGSGFALGGGGKPREWAQKGGLGLGRKAGLATGPRLGEGAGRVGGWPGTEPRLHQCPGGRDEGRSGELRSSRLRTQAWISPGLGLLALQDRGPGPQVGEGGPAASRDSSRLGPPGSDSQDTTRCGWKGCLVGSTQSRRLRGGGASAIPSYLFICSEFHKIRLLMTHDSFSP